MPKLIMLLAALAVLAACNGDWLNWTAYSSGVDTSPTEIICHETPHAFGGPPAHSCVEI